MSSEELDDLLLKFGGTGEKERGSRDVRFTRFGIVFRINMELESRFHQRIS